MFGYTGKILRVNLDEREVSFQRLAEEDIYKWLGGNGFGVKILYDEVEAKTDPLGRENRLIFSPGPFTGTRFPGSGKCGVFAKSPLTGLLGESYSGGRFGAFLKQAGYDVLIVEGRADSPVYLFIGEKVEIRDSGYLWGKHTFATEGILKKDLNLPNVSVASIGPAGEKLVKFACITNEKGHQFGRTGMGAVMGSKNLKAIVVCPGDKVNVAAEEELSRKIQKKVKQIKNSPVWDTLVKAGTAGSVTVYNELGFNPTRNFWSGHANHNKVKELAGHNWVTKYNAKSKGCYSCVMPCSKVVRIRGSRYGAIDVEGPELETVSLIGTNCEIFDLEAVAKANEMCDRFGIDTISFGVVTGFAMECCEKGFLTKRDVDSIDLTFGNADGMLEILTKISDREGIGDLLSEGVKWAAQEIGNGSDFFAMHSKGLEFAGYDVRGIKGMGLSFAVSNRGACHLRSSSYVAEINGSFLPLGIEGQDRLNTQDKGSMVGLLENYQSVLDSLVLCKFYRSFFTPGELGEIGELITGRSFSGEDLMKIGERITNCERLFNCREGISRKDDTLPKRVTGEPMPIGPSKEERLSQEDLDSMLTDYYGVRGWDFDGKPLSSVLKKLDIENL
jgi:aldehyde:ferredoxin oxidoreductase